MQWNAATGAIARCNTTSIACVRMRRFVRALHWICGAKPKPKAVNKPLHHFIVHGLDKPGSSATVSFRRLMKWHHYHIKGMAVEIDEFWLFRT